MIWYTLPSLCSSFHRLIKMFLAVDSSLNTMTSSGIIPRSTSMLSWSLFWGKSSKIQPPVLETTQQHYFYRPKNNAFTLKKAAGNYIFKVTNRSTRKRCEIRSKLTIKTPEQRQWRHSDVFIVKFEHISYLVLVLTLSR